MDINIWELTKLIVPSVVVPIVVSYGAIKFQLGKIEGTIGGMMTQLGYLDKKIDDYLKFMIEGVKSIYTREAPQSLKDKVEELKVIMDLVRPSGNPISQDDIDRFNNIKDKIIKGESPTEEELEDFAHLATIVKEELPSQGEKEKFATLVSSLSGYASGLILGSIFKIKE